MTTIAYRDGVLAADSAMSDGDIIVSREAVKIWRVGGDLYGFSGAAALSWKFKSWTEAGCGSEKTPGMGDSAGEGVRIAADGSVWIYDRHGEWYPMKSSFYAVGTGWEIATGAMAAGATAAEAVKIACDFDKSSVEPVVVLDLREKVVALEPIDWDHDFGRLERIASWSE